MITARLIKELAAEIRRATAGLKLEAEYPAQEVAVNVFEQVLPREAYESTSYLPFVAVEFLSVKDDLQTHSTIRIGLTIATYAPDYKGWLDAAHVMEVLRLHMLTNRVIGKRFRLEGELSFETPDTQPEAFFYILGEATYSTMQPAGC